VRKHHDGRPAFSRLDDPQPHAVGVDEACLHPASEARGQGIERRNCCEIVKWRRIAI
jgi:hypothetical protein